MLVKHNVITTFFWLFVYLERILQRALNKEPSAGFSANTDTTVVVQLEDAVASQVIKAEPIKEFRGKVNALDALQLKVTITEHLFVMNLPFSVFQRNEKCYDVIFRWTFIHFCQFIKSYGLILLCQEPLRSSQVE